jgi:hypothetical protein
VRLAQKITQELLPFWPGEYVAVFEDIRPTDVQARLAEIRTAYPVLSINEIRQRYYQLPAAAWGDLPVGMQANHPEAIHETPGEETEDAAELAADGAKAALIELRRWERFTLKRWGQDSARAFEVRALPDEVAFEVAAGLLVADSVDDAQAVFKAARDEVLAS